AAAARYLERVAGRYDLDFWSREGDLRAALEAEDAGLAEPALLTASDISRGLLIFTCRRPTSRLREGDRLAVRGFGGRLAGILREVAAQKGEPRRLTVEITAGQRLAQALSAGQEVVLHPTSLSAIAIRKRMLLRESKARLPWLFDPGQKLPDPAPRGRE